jgi:iron complex outermembrane recepter protein
VLPLAGVVFYQEAHNFSEEFQIRNSEPGRLTWIAGAYYYDSTGAYDPFLVNDAPVIPDDSQRTVSSAGFAQASYKMWPDTQITGGIRYTSEQQTYELPAAAEKLSQSVDKVTYRIALDHHFTEDILGYLSYNTGFKSGGFNLLAPGNAFKPEKLASTEVGLKTELLDRRLRINLGGFFYDYKDQQYFLAGQYSSTLANAPGSHIKGLELNFNALPISDLTVSGGLTLLNGHFTNLPDYIALDSQGVPSLPYNAKGNSTVDTPSVVATLSAQYSWLTSIGKIASSVGLQYDSGYYWLPDNRLTQPSYTLLNASITWSPESEQYGVKFWIKNALNATYYLSRVDLPAEGDAQMQAPPLTGGFTLFYHF